MCYQNETGFQFHPNVLLQLQGRKINQPPPFEKSIYRFRPAFRCGAYGKFFAGHRKIPPHLLMPYPGSLATITPSEFLSQTLIRPCRLFFMANRRP
jgi:hypothetical protein